MDELDGHQSAHSTRSPQAPIPTQLPVLSVLFELRIIIAFAIWMAILRWEIYG